MLRNATSLQHFFLEIPLIFLLYLSVSCYYTVRFTLLILICMRFHGKREIAASAVIIRMICLLCIIFLAFNTAFAQQALKITKMREVKWDSYSREWSPWPVDWRSYTAGNEPIITLYRLDNDGYRFRVNMTIGVQRFSFDVSYNGFDQKNNWSKYADANGDEVDIVGSTMSKLSQYGWPDSVVQIYFWIYSSNVGFELE